MNWAPPAVVDLLESRMSDALEAIRDDPRVSAAREGASTEEPRFVTECLAAPLHAAAAVGFSAAEATLRAEAHRHLASAGVPPEASRRVLDEAAGFIAITEPSMPRPRNVSALYPIGAAAGVFTLLSIWNWGAPRVALASGAGVAAGALAHWRRRAAIRQINRDLVESLPSQLAFAYRAQLDAEIESYQKHIDRAAHSDGGRE